MINKAGLAFTRPCGCAIVEAFLSHTDRKTNHQDIKTAIVIKFAQ